jgi:hypothetical protein
LWSYAYPYQRHILARAITWCAKEAPAIRIAAPRCVQTTFYNRQAPAKANQPTQRQLVIHFFNNVNTTAALGNPANEVPLREESLPIHGIRVTLTGPVPNRFHLEPTGTPLQATHTNHETTIELPALDIHSMLIGEWDE